MFLQSIPDAFWQTIQDAGQNPARFRQILGNMTRNQMVDFYWTYSEVATYLRTEEYISSIHQDLSEDGMAELANWVVAQGKEYYENMYLNPERMPPKKNDVGLLSELVEVFEEVYQEDLPINRNYWNNEWKKSGWQSPWG